MAEADELEVTLHRVRPADWRSHRDLRLEMLRDAPDASRTQYADVADLDEEAWRRRADAQHHLQARVGGDPVGSVGIVDDPGQPDEVVTLVAMYVVPRARGRGVGRHLVQAVLDEAAARGKRRVVLEVTSGNASAVALYERMGFRFTGEQAPHPRSSELLELVMECDLRGPRTQSRPTGTPGAYRLPARTRMPAEAPDVEG